MRSGLSSLGIVVSAVCLGAVIWWAVRQPAPELPDTAAEVGWLLAAVGLYALNTAIRAERWHRLLDRDGARPPRADSYALTVIGYTGNNVLPARAGDAVRVVLMAPRAHTQRRTVVGTLLAERLLDIAVIVVLFVAVGYGILGEVGGGDLEVVAAASAALLSAAAASALLLRRSARLRTLLAPVFSSTLNLRSGHGATMLAMTGLIWLVETGVWMTVGAAAGLPMNLLEGLYLVALASVFAMIPSGPAYAGTQDAAAVIGVKAIGGSGALALGYVLILRFVLVVPITLTGVVLLAARYGGVSKLRRASLEARADVPA